MVGVCTKNVGSYLKNNTKKTESLRLQRPHVAIERTTKAFKTANGSKASYTKFNSNIFSTKLFTTYYFLFNLLSSVKHIRTPPGCRLRGRHLDQTNFDDWWPRKAEISSFFRRVMSLKAKGLGFFLYYFSNSCRRFSYIPPPCLQHRS